MKLKWIVVFIAPHGGMPIRIGTISHAKMYKIIASIGHSDGMVEDFMAEGEFIGMYNVEFFREDNAHLIDARVDAITKEEAEAQEILHLNPLTWSYE